MLPTAADERDLTRAYLLAKERVICAGFEEEIAWQEAASGTPVTAVLFMREAAWVVLSAGMREAVVRSRFASLEQAFSGWEPAQIAADPEAHLRRGLDLFRHVGKMAAIVSIAQLLARDGVTRLLDDVRQHGPASLTSLPYIGPVVCFHLAKNLGFPVAKPDRHLVRIADRCGYSSPEAMCGTLAAILDEPIAVVDLVLWRYATIERRYLEAFQMGARMASPSQ